MTSDSFFLRFFQFFFFLVFLFTASAQAFPHRPYGIFYPGNSAENITLEQLEYLENTGFSWIMVEKELSADQLNAIRKTDFSLYVLIPEYFSIPRHIVDPSRNYTEKASQLLTYYRNNTSVKGFGLLAYSNWNRPIVQSYLEELIETIDRNASFFVLDTRPGSGHTIAPFDGVLLQTRSSERLGTQLKSHPSLSGILYQPSKIKADPSDLEDVLLLHDTRSDVPLFFTEEWFFGNAVSDSVTKSLSVAHIIHHYARFQDAKVATPKRDYYGKNVNTTIFLLFFLWICYAAFYRLNPIYRKSVSRFFLNYDFFVNDILMKRIRLPGNAAVLYFISCSLAGIMAYATADLFLDSIALSALLQYLPIINPGWSHPVFFFFFFFIIAALINGIQIIWLLIANRAHAQLYQIAVLLLWPHHINILLVSAGVMLLRSFPSDIIAASMFILYWGITIASFFLTAYNMRHIYPTSPLYMAMTYVLFVIVNAAVISWLIFGLNLAEAWKLAASLAQF